MPHRHFKLSVIAAVLLALLFAGCGKKGPLYHPDSPPKPAHKMAIFVQACFPWTIPELRS